jgi:hypothetical protein
MAHPLPVLLPVKAKSLISFGLDIYQMYERASLGL